MAVAAFHGLRRPGAWAFNYYQFGWEDGLWRRGLVGALLAPLGCGRFDPRLLGALQAGVLASTLATLGGLSLRRWLPLAVGCLVLATDAGTFLFNEIGYPDQWMALATVAAVLLVRKGRPGWATALSVLAVLAHEAALVTVVPALALASAERIGSPRGWFLRLGPPLACAAGIALLPSLPLADVQAALARAAACGWPVARPDYFRPFLDPSSTLRFFYYNRWEWTLQILPLAAALRWWLGSRPGAWLRWGVCLAPLALGAVGWDTGRWIFLVVLQVWTLLALDLVPGDGGRGGRLVPLAVVLLLLRIPLFDGYRPRPLNATGWEDFRATCAGWPLPPAKPPTGAP